MHVTKRFLSRVAAIGLATTVGGTALAADQPPPGPSGATPDLETVMDNAVKASGPAGATFRAIPRQHGAASMLKRGEGNYIGVSAHISDGKLVIDARDDGKLNDAKDNTYVMYQIAAQANALQCAVASPLRTSADLDLKSDATPDQAQAVKAMAKGVLTEVRAAYHISPAKIGVGCK